MIRSADRMSFVYQRNGHQFCASIKWLFQDPIGLFSAQAFLTFRNVYKKKFGYHKSADFLHETGLYNM